MTLRAISAPSPFLPSAPAHAPQTAHIGIADAPFVVVELGFELQLLHVDLKQGLWVIRARWAPGAAIARHYHAGPVLAVTLQGQWFYRESPDQVNSAGSYLFEPAGSIHTLTVPADQSGPTVVWFAITGPNLNLSDTDQVVSIVDAASILGLYRAGCTAMGQGSDHVIVVD
jgi:quercetin dioxygenase-like cupin family protein